LRPLLLVAVPLKPTNTTDFRGNCLRSRIYQRPRSSRQSDCGVSPTSVQADEP
jgi:hypothetical protein